jgi:hypothetical protein
MSRSIYRLGALGTIMSDAVNPAAVSFSECLAVSFMTVAIPGRKGEYSSTSITGCLQSRHATHAVCIAVFRVQEICEYG